jgi:hypothetical protein
MIGWRPVLLTALALIVIAGAVLDVVAAGRKPDVCAPAQKLVRGRDFTAARSAYDTVLKQDPDSSCAVQGLRQVTAAQCVQAQRIAVSDPAAAHQQLLALAEQDPVPGATDPCVWDQLQATASSASTG